MAQSTITNPFLDARYQVPFADINDPDFHRTVSVTKTLLHAYMNVIAGVLFRDPLLHPGTVSSDSVGYVFEKCLKKLIFDSDTGTVTPEIKFREDIEFPNLFLSGSFPLAIFQWIYGNLDNMRPESRLYWIMERATSEYNPTDIDLFLCDFSDDAVVVPRKITFLPPEILPGSFSLTMFNMFKYYQKNLCVSSSYDVNEILKTDPIHKEYGDDRAIKCLRRDFGKLLEGVSPDTPFPTKTRDVLTSYNGMKLGPFNLVWRMSSSSPGRIMESFDLSCCRLGYDWKRSELVFAPSVVDAIRNKTFTLTDIPIRFETAVSSRTEERINKYKKKGYAYVEPS